GDFASRGGDWIRYARQPAAQWRGSDTAFGVRLDPPRKLWRHCHGWYRWRRDCTRCCDYGRLDARILLISPLLLAQITSRRARASPILFAVKFPSISSEDMRADPEKPSLPRASVEAMTVTDEGKERTVQSHTVPDR